MDTAWKAINNGLPENKRLFRVILAMTPALAIANVTINGLLTGCVLFLVLLSTQLTLSLIRKIIADEIK
jgi:Na+-translocating ferredoxin:NAD+ oxidoreductase RnfE subunit